MSKATCQGVEVETTYVRRRPASKVARFTIEVEIEYPTDMPNDLIFTYAKTIEGWCVNYAKAQAVKEERSHQEN